jgi:hypothetical protein
MREKHIAMSAKFQTREMKFFAAMLGDGLFDTLRYARPSLVEIFKGIFIYSESDRMAIFKWEEGTVPERIFGSKKEGNRDVVEIRCKCGGFFSEIWADDYVKTFDFKDINIFEERFCDRCNEEKNEYPRFSTDNSMDDDIVTTADKVDVMVEADSHLSYPENLPDYFEVKAIVDEPFTVPARSRARKHAENSKR